MSFLSGIGSFLGKAVGFLTGPGIGSTLARTVIAGYALRKLSAGALKGNDTQDDENIDEGVRLQVRPNSTNRIPVLYGTAYFGGIISDAELASNNQTMYYCVTLCEKTGTGTDSVASTYTFKDVYWNDTRIVFQSDGITADYAIDRDGNVDRNISGLVKIHCYAGDSNSPVAPQGYSNGSLPNASSVMPSWTSAQAMNDLVFIIVEVTYNREKSLTNLGEITVELENSLKEPGHVLYDYMKNAVFGAGIPADYIDNTALNALNTYSAESVNYDSDDSTAATLADRYQINGLIDTSRDVMSNLEAIASAAGSWVTFDIFSGKWSVAINKEGTSVASFDDSNIVGNIGIQGTGIQDLYNSVRVEFPNRDIRDAPDFAKIDIPEADRNDNEFDNTLNISYNLLNEPIQAEILGLIELKQTRVDLIVTFRADYSYMNLKAGEIIDLTNTAAGWTNKDFRIISVREIHDADGALSVEFTALEYDANVYAVDDLFRFIRSDQTGIIAIGSIGTPGTPQVTKFERDSRPRVEIESTTPTGVVEALEYWATTDQDADDADRSYNLIATERPVGGGVFSSGTTVTLDYDALASNNFFVKTRGVNAITVGPFSAPSGFTYTPQQQTDAVGPDTDVLDGLGGLATTLGLLSLLNGVDGLFGKDTAGGSLFESIFDAFSDDTGVDIRGDAAAGSLVVDAAIAIEDEGTEIVSQVGSLNFVGDAVVASANGTDVTVTISGTGGGGNGGGSGVVEVLAPSGFRPTDDTDDNTESAQYSPRADIQWDVTGSCYIRYYSTQGSFDVGELSAGSGSYHLYKSDDTLVESVAIGSCTIDVDVVEIPFGTRDFATDYYVLADEGVVAYCGIESQTINSKTEWNFNTKPNASSTGTAITALVAANKQLTVTGVDAGGACFYGSDLIVTFSHDIAAGSGEIKLKDYNSGSTVDTFTIGSAVIGGNIANFGEINVASPSSQYYFEIPANLVIAGSSGCAISGNEAFDSVLFNTPVLPTVTEVYYYKQGSEIEASDSTAGIEPETDFRIVFNESIRLGTGVITVGSQSIDPATANSIVFSHSGNTIRLNPTVDFTPGSTVTLTIPAALIKGCGGLMASNYTLTFGVDNLAMMSPSNVTNNVPQSVPSTVELTTDRTISAGTGNYRILDESSTVVAENNASHSSVTLAN